MIKGDSNSTATKQFQGSPTLLYSDCIAFVDRNAL